MSRIGRALLVGTLILLPGALMGGPSVSRTMVTPTTNAAPVDDREHAPRAAASNPRAAAAHSVPHARTDRTWRERGVSVGRDAAVGGDAGQAPRARRASERGRDSLRALGTDPMTAIIEVAEDVASDWGDELRARQQQDPDGLRQSILSNGRRLIALAVLRDREPELYRLKVIELRLQRETNDALVAYHAAIMADQSQRAELLLEDVRRRVQQQIDHDLRTRAEELAALDQQVRRLREQLVEDSMNRDVRIDRMLEVLIADAPLADAPATARSTGAE